MPAEAFQPFVVKWQARELEMAIAEVFCPAAARQRFRIWGALLHELREALFELSDPRLTAIKSGWWAEELIGVGAGRSRHPLTECLVGIQAPWSNLARDLLDACTQDIRAGTTAEAIETLLPLARSVVAVEAAVFGVPASEAAAQSLVVHWLLSRLPAGLAADDRARIPMFLIARHGWVPGESTAAQQAELLRDWATELLGGFPARPDGSLFRRARATFDRARLARMASGKADAPPPRLATLWLAWRAARAV